MVKASVLKETRPGERRVALVPSVAEKLASAGFTLSIQSGAGAPIFLSDSAYKGVAAVADTGALVSGADIVLAVQPPRPETVRRMRRGAVLISFLYPAREPDVLAAIVDAGVTALAMERVPRITRAQAMDALSSQAALAGYHGALLGATHLSRILPMMSSAAGTIRPATVLIMGLGVAGLQAVATSRRLGAIVECYDVRPETREQAASLGAKFVDTGVDARDAGGYARRLTDEEQQKVSSVVSSHIRRADIIITTAAVPGRPAPKLISAEQVGSMKAGSVIVDLAADSGGNCELTRPGETITAGPALIVAPLNVASCVAVDASELYSRNVQSLLALLVTDGALALDWDDEIVATMAVARDGVPTLAVAEARAA